MNQRVILALTKVVFIHLRTITEVHKAFPVPKHQQHYFHSYRSQPLFHFIVFPALHIDWIATERATSLSAEVQQPALIYRTATTSGRSPAVATWSTGTKLTAAGKHLLH